MLRWSLTVLLFTVGVAAGACKSSVRSNDDDNGTSTASGSGGAGGAPTAGSKPPGPPVDGVPGDGPGYTYAMRTLLLGDVDRNGVASKVAWKEFGYDIDGKSSTAASTDVCAPSAGAKSTVHDDGLLGIDNAWGKELMPIFHGLWPTIGSDLNESIANGEFTHLVRIEALGSAPDYLGLNAPYYIGTNLGAPAHFDGTDQWPVAPELLNDPGDITSSRIVFGSSYVNDHVWVSGPRGSLVAQIVLAGTPFFLRMHQAVVSMQLSVDRTAIADGVISGILDTEEFIDQFRAVAGTFSPTLCDGATFESIANQLRGASDILLDGTQDPLQTCNGISIGLGFNGTRAELGSVAPPTVPPPDPCAG